MTNEVDTSDTSTAPANEAERMIPVSEVTKTVAARYNAALEKGEQKGYERGRAEALAETQSHQPAATIDESKVRAVAQETMQNYVASQLMQQNTAQFVNKIKSSALDFPGLDQAVAENAEVIRDAVPYLNSIENTAEVTKHLVDNPEKAFQLKMMNAAGDFKTAQAMVNKLSKSLVDNRQAQKAPPRDPLSQMKPSKSGGDNDGPVSIADLRKSDLIRKFSR